MDRWQGERNAPAFTLMSGDICRDLDAGGFDMAIVGAVRPEVLPAVFKSLEPAGNPVLLCDEEKQSAQEDAARCSRESVSCSNRKAGWMRWCWSPRKFCGTARPWRVHIAPSRRKDSGAAGGAGPLHAGRAAHAEQCTYVGHGEFRVAVARARNRSPRYRVHRLKPSVTWRCACTKSCSVSLPSRRN